MADIAPEIYEKIKETFNRQYNQAQLLGEPLHDVMNRIKSGDATYTDADLYAVTVGSMMAEAIKANLKLDELPGKQLYRNISQKTIGEGLKDTYGLVSNICRYAQEEMNASIGVNLKPVTPKLETSRVDNIVNKAAVASTQEALDATLDNNFPTFAQQVVDDSKKANARQHNKAGLSVKVEREYDGVGLHEGTDVCDWCLQRAGTWTYEKAMSVGAFERHEGCGCIIEYTSAKGEKTVSVSKYDGWMDERDQRIQAAKEENAEKIKRYKEQRETRIAIDKAQSINEQEKIAALKAAKSNGDSTQPPEYQGNFEDYKSLEISDELRNTFTALNTLAKETGYEHGRSISDGEWSDYQTDKDHNHVTIYYKADSKDVGLYHSHTDDSPFSGKDFHAVLDSKVSRIGVITANEDVWVIDFTYGIRPTENELNDGINMCYNNAIESIQREPNYDNWTPEERYYMLVREQMRTVSNYFEWDIMGGGLNE